MYEVKVYDNVGNLKKVISAKTLCKREDKIFKTPFFLRKKGGKVKPQVPKPEVRA